MTFVLLKLLESPLFPQLPGDGTTVTNVVVENPQNDAAAEVTVVEDETDESQREKLREELAELRRTPISSSAVPEMSYVELAAALAAFIVKYEMQLVDTFEGMRCRLE